MVEDVRSKRYGYIMDVREESFRALTDFMARRIRPSPSMRALLMAGMKLADGFLRLHSQGLCYRDISAEVVPHPRKPDLFGLRNLGSEKWTLTRQEDGKVDDVPPGRTAPILDGNRIHFGQRTGEVRA